VGERDGNHSWKRKPFDWSGRLSSSRGAREVILEEGENWSRAFKNFSGDAASWGSEKDGEMEVSGFLSVNGASRCTWRMLRAVQRVPQKVAGKSKRVGRIQLVQVPLLKSDGGRPYGKAIGEHATGYMARSSCGSAKRQRLFPRGVGAKRKQSKRA